jgi:hypothetical protein
MKAELMKVVMGMEGGSYYELNCVCGEYVRTTGTVTKCGKCGRELEVMWGVGIRRPEVKSNEG